ncbi:MAG TPA: vitamin K epoxide reductase family protein [Acidobacteriaceae bacterium]|nr:vitamin K epoxide reductase family protein [Acidobacteriaceae bacterium]
MRYVLTILSVTGIALSFLSLAAHYGPPAQAIDLLHSNWNSAYVNQSPYATVHRIPVALLGIAGYTLLAVLAWQRRTVLMVYFSAFGLAYALYLTNIEGHILRVWCVYSVSSLILIVLIVFLAFASLIFDRTPVMGQ